MQRTYLRPIILLVAVALVAPGAAATWYGYGTHEPDNAYDDPDFMRVDPPGAATNLIYFNVVTQMSGGLRGIGASPNAGLVQSANEVPAMEAQQGVLGVWVDCNGDGYIGMAETALREYPAALLADTTICPALEGPTNRWTEGAHNYNGWVSELVPIGGAFGFTGNASNDLRVYADPDAMIWGDVGLPTSGAAGATCPIAPQPRGTYQSTGGFMNYVDCHMDRPATGGLGLMETANRPWNGGRLLGQDVPGLGADPAGVVFPNDDDARGSWADRPTFGSADESNSPVFIYDCASGPTTVGATANQTPVGPLLPGQVQRIGVPSLNPRINQNAPTTWTVPGLVNHTIEGANVTNLPSVAGSPSGASVRGSADCNTSNDAGHDFYGASWATFYVGENEFNPVTATNKRAAIFNFQFQYWARGAGSAIAGSGPPGQAGLPTGTSGMSEPGDFYSNWNPGSVNTKADTNRLVRTDIKEGSADLPSALLFTFYAHIGQATRDRGFQLPSGTTGKYGEAQCTGYEGTISPSGWNCDGTQWYRNPNGEPTVETVRRARPMQVYQMRDVDCQDGRIAGLGVGVQPAYYGSSPCEPYAG